MNINANNIIPEFSQANMNAIIQAYPLGALLYRDFFPLEFNPNLTYSSIEGAEGAKDNGRPCSHRLKGTTKRA